MCDLFQLSLAEFESWSIHFRQASLALDDRDDKLAIAADIIERDMVVSKSCFLNL